MISTTVEKGTNVPVAYHGRAMHIGMSDGKDIIVVAEDDEVLKQIYALMRPGMKPKSGLWKNVRVTPVKQGE